VHERDQEQAGREHGHADRRSQLTLELHEKATVGDRADPSCSSRRAPSMNAGSPAAPGARRDRARRRRRAGSAPGTGRSSRCPCRPEYAGIAYRHQDTDEPELIEAALTRPDVMAPYSTLLLPFGAA
jgi:hypothetical protein